MECMKVYGGNSLLNLFLNKLYQARPGDFSSNGTAGGFNFSYNTLNAPTGKFVFSASPKPNLTIKLSSVDIRIARIGGAGPSLQVKYIINATGKLTISNGILSISSLNVAIENPGVIDALILPILNGNVLPAIQNSLQHILLPQIQNIFGTGLNASLYSGKVISGPALLVGARVSGQNISDADNVSTIDLASLNTNNVNKGKLIGLVSGAAINVLIRSRLTSIPSQSFDKRQNLIVGEIGIKGSVNASVPEFSISNSSGSAKTTISFNGVKVGGKLGFLPWLWFNIALPSFKVVVRHQLKVNNDKGIISLTGVDSLKVVFNNFPSELNGVKRDIENLFNNVVLPVFKSNISNAIAGISFEVFDLPTRIPGTSLVSEIKYNGLGYYRSSVKAEIELK